MNGLKNGNYLYRVTHILYVGNTDGKLSMWLNRNTLPVVNEVKDLGVVFVNHLTFHFHVDKIIAHAFIRWNLILKCFVSRDVATLMWAFIWCMFDPHWNIPRALGPNI